MWLRVKDLLARKWVVTIICVIVFSLINLGTARIWHKTYGIEKITAIHVFSWDGAPTVVGDIIKSIYPALAEVYNDFIFRSDIDEGINLGNGYSPYWRVLNGLWLLLFVPLIRRDIKEIEHHNIYYAGYSRNTTLAVIATVIFIGFVLNIPAALMLSENQTMFPVEYTFWICFIGILFLIFLYEFFRDRANTFTQAKLIGFSNGVFCGLLLGTSMVYGFFYMLFVYAYALAAVIALAFVIALFYLLSTCICKTGKLIKDKFNIHIMNRLLT